jgi:sulfite reductase (NADPH) flavoprotein alpha-component
VNIKPSPIIPDNAPFNPAQRAWLNGYMAGLLAGRMEREIASEKSNSIKATVPLLILFGSQTGTSEKLARDILKQSKVQGCDSRVLDASAFATIDWKKETNLFVVTSTYGDGDMPDNAQPFWDWLQTEAVNSLAHIRFSVLALGDTNYEHFCAAGKKIDARLEQLGATRIHPLAECDVDYEAKAKSWMISALGVLTSATEPETSLSISATAAEVESGVEKYSKTNPFPARLLTNHKLSGEGSAKETRHFEISLEGSGLAYEAGDALGVYPTNCDALVADVLHALGFDGEEAVPTPSGGELPLRKALTTTFDITKPSPDFLKKIAERNSTLRELLGPGRAEDLRKWLWGREVIDLLITETELHFSPGEFVSILKRLAPRLYSISSSPKAHAGQVHATISVVRYDSHGRGRKGVASTFLADRVGEESHVPVFIQPSHGFRLPANGDTPIIMVGPGTGIAPFRAFLHERRSMGAKGGNWLLFGEQRAATDFYYREELEKMRADGHLTKLSTAFSRDQQEKIYVQHRMAEQAAEIWAWLQDGAHFYVCGDASRMAKDVDAALHSAIATAGNLTGEKAAEYVTRLKSEKRYQRDVY